MIRRVYVVVLVVHLIAFACVVCKDDEGSGSGDDEDPPTFPQILKITIEAITSSRDAKKDKEILLKYYFTDKKNFSVWSKIVEETEKTSGEEFEERELADLEQVIRRVYKRLLECDVDNPMSKKARKGKEGKKRDEEEIQSRATCYKTLDEFTEVGFVDFNFPRGNVQQQAHMFEMNMAYNVMVLLVHHMISSMSVSTGIESYATQLKFYSIAEALVDSIDPAKLAAEDSRIQLITPVVVCQVQEILWQLFTGECEMGEDRVRRSVLMDTLAPSAAERTTRSANNTRKGHIKNKLDHNSKAFGGTPNLLSQKYKATVTDEVTGEVICDEEGGSGTEENVGKAKDKLIKICSKKRKAYVEKVRVEVKKYYCDRSDVISKQLPRLWDSDKSKLEKVKAELKANEKKKKSEQKTSLNFFEQV